MTAPSFSFGNVTESLCEDFPSHEEAHGILAPLTEVLEGQILTVVNIFGVTANLLAIPILGSRELRNTFNRTLAVLAVFDLMYNICDLLEVCY